jgi:hypothetical protein
MAATHSRFVDKYNSRYKIYQPGNGRGKVCQRAVRPAQHCGRKDAWEENTDDPGF